MQNHKTALVFGFLTVGAFLAYGWWGYEFLIVPFALPVLVAATILSAKRSTIFWCMAIILVLGAWFLLFVPMLGYASPPARLANDLNNLKQIGMALQEYHRAKQVFPEKLSQLWSEGYLISPIVFTSPRGAGQIDYRQEGPLQCLNREPNPGPVHEPNEPSDVDQGDYIYIKPPETAKSDAIILMTRPGLLYRNRINVLYFNQATATLDYDHWKTRQDILNVVNKSRISTTRYIPRVKRPDIPT